MLPNPLRSLPSWLAALVLLASPLPAFATSLVFATDGTTVIGLADVNVNGTLYDITFVAGSFNAVDVGAAFPFIGDQTAASIVAGVIVAELNNAGITAIAPLSPITNAMEVRVPYLPAPTAVRAFQVANANQAPCPPTGSWSVCDYPYDRIAPSVWAVMSVVPEPSLPALGTVGLVAFAVRRRFRGVVA